MMKTTSYRSLTDAERAELKMLTSMPNRSEPENDRRNYLVSIHNASALAGLDTMKRALQDATNRASDRGPRRPRRH
jgi:hypothetical protein